MARQFFQQCHGVTQQRNNLIRKHKKSTPFPKHRGNKPARQRLRPAQDRNVFDPHSEKLMRQLDDTDHPLIMRMPTAQTPVPVKLCRTRFERRGNVAQP